MTAIPPPTDTIQARIDAAHEARQSGPRGHLGASVLKHKCDRWLWLSFRWAVQERFPGRVLRIFRRGHHEEAWFVQDLKAAGLEVTHTGRDQLYVKLAPHIGGSVDGVIESGVPEAPKARHIVEFKTHSAKSFADLSKGVQASKPMHYAQMQLYMHGTGIDRALYVAVCKDDDRLYTERVRYDKAFAEALIDRGRRIVGSEVLPDGISADPTWFECKMCAAWEFCHKTRLTREVNCRTCAHVTATDAGTWHCERWGDVVPEDFQRTGCEAHVLHPALVPWERRLSNDAHEAVYVIDGVEVRNGEGDAHTFASREIIDNTMETLVKATFPGASVKSVVYKSGGDGVGFEQSQLEQTKGDSDE
jgi:hypothetical protein